jgi:hypothetical protein
VILQENCIVERNSRYSLRKKDREGGH